MDISQFSNIVIVKAHALSLLLKRVLIAAVPNFLHVNIFSMLKPNRLA
jgi:hypothetical protein